MISVLFLNMLNLISNLMAYFHQWKRLATNASMLDDDKQTVCHNDAHARNWLVRKFGFDEAKAHLQLPQTVLIDWEFAGLSHPANELGNIICMFIVTLLLTCQQVL